MGKVAAALTPKGKEFQKVCRRCAGGTLTKRGAITPLVYELGRANCLPGPLRRRVEFVLTRLSVRFVRNATLSHSYDPP